MAEHYPERCSFTDTLLVTIMLSVVALWGTYSMLTDCSVCLTFDVMSCGHVMRSQHRFQAQQQNFSSAGVHETNKQCMASRAMQARQALGLGCAAAVLDHLGSGAGLR
jgi:hypothetical protein